MMQTDCMSAWDSFPATVTFHSATCIVLYMHMVNHSPRLSHKVTEVALLQHCCHKILQSSWTVSGTDNTTQHNSGLIWRGSSININFSSVTVKEMTEFGMIALTFSPTGALTGTVLKFHETKFLLLI